jgi:D-3-phosphoglycerate dehydrogenase
MPDTIRAAMPGFSVLYTDRGDYSHDFSIEQPIYDAIGAKIVDARLDHNAIDWDRYEQLLSEADAVICFRMPVNRRAVEAAPKLKVAVRSGVGFENFDLAAFTERNIPACNVPDYGSEEVAVHALALIMALRRHVVLFDRELRAGRWRGWRNDLTMYRLSRQTAGVIGLGRIGTEFARRARALFGRVLACDPYVPASRFEELGVTPASLEEVLREADAISLHVPLTEETHHLIGAPQLKLMKPNAVIVNTSRGMVMDQLALGDALASKAIDGAACDVWEREPADLQHPLLEIDNFIASPHVAGLSVEGQIDNRTKQAQEVVRVLRGEPPRNPVN